MLQLLFGDGQKLNKKEGTGLMILNWQVQLPLTKRPLWGLQETVPISNQSLPVYKKCLHKEVARWIYRVSISGEELFPR